MLTGPHNQLLRPAQRRLLIEPMTQPLSRIEGTAGARRHFRYFDYMLAAFVTILLLSNLIGAAKLANVGGHISARASCFSRSATSWAMC